MVCDPLPPWPCATLTVFVTVLPDVTLPTWDWLALWLLDNAALELRDAARAAALELDVEDDGSSHAPMARTANASR